MREGPRTSPEDPTLQEHSWQRDRFVAEAEARLDMLPRSVERYTLFEEIALGGMGAVHLGLLEGAAGFRRPVAIKRPHLLYGRRAANDQLQQEAWLGSRVRHPNVVPVLDLIETGGNLFLVMEFVLGETLAGLAQKRDMPIGVAVAILCEVLAGLHAVHTAAGEDGRALGIVHRDVSPQNIIVGADGFTRILDFGVAKCLAPDGTGRETTKAGLVKGKPGYMAPEQLISGTVDVRTDIFSAGVVLWEALARRRLFRGHEPAQILSKLAAVGVPPPSAFNSSVTPSLDAVVARAVHSNPTSRFQSADEFAEQLLAAVPSAAVGRVRGYVEATAPLRLARQRSLLRRLELSPPSQPEPRRSLRSRSRLQGGKLLGATSLGLLLLAGAAYAFTRCARRSAEWSASPITAEGFVQKTIPNASAVPSTHVPASTREDAAGSRNSLGGIANRGAAQTPSRPDNTKQPAMLKAPAPRHPIAAPPTCDPPYWVDSDGIKRVKSWCS